MESPQPPSDRFDFNGERPAERIVRWFIKGVLITINAVFGGDYGGIEK